MAIPHSPASTRAGTVLIYTLCWLRTLLLSKNKLIALPSEMSACFSPVPYIYVSFLVNPGFPIFCILSVPLESIFFLPLFFFHLNFPFTSSPLSSKPNKSTFLSPNRGRFMFLRQQPLSWPDLALVDTLQLLPSST